MKTTVLISLMIAVIAMPAMATEPDIPAGATNSSCDSGVLKTTDGSVNLRAEWSANNIALEWYNGDTKISPDNNAANTCEYAGGITLPTNTPTKLGYTFVGWRVRPAFDMTTLENVTPGAYMFKGFVPSDPNYDQFCSMTCNGSGLIFLNEGEWTVSFGDDGTIKGESICSTTPGTSQGQTGNPTNETNYEDAGYCWCRASGFAGVGSDTYQPVASPSWVFVDGYIGSDSAGACAHFCANDCVTYVHGYDAFRRAIFGI